MAIPKITASEQRKIEVMLRTWTGKLTWSLLVKAVEFEVGIKTTRQTLCTYTGIANEYKERKAALRGATRALYTDISASDISLHKRVKNLEAELEVLEKKNSEQLRLLERIFMNARTIPNLNLQQLIEPRSDET